MHQRDRGLSVGAAQDGYMAADEFFIYKFSREQAGLSGLAFDEGQFGVFGYVTAVRTLTRAANVLSMWACLPRTRH